MEEHVHAFRLSGLGGEVAVRYEPNADPSRWGYDLLGLDYPSAVASGFPALRADVAYEGDGYAATLGWMQVVWMATVGEQEPRVIVDVAPQLIETGFPYVSFGIEPTMFDAPSTTDAEVDWLARSFLTASPDRLMTRIVEPILGLRWGYVLRGAVPRLKDLARASDEDWQEARSVLAASFPRMGVPFGLGQALNAKRCEGTAGLGHCSGVTPERVPVRPIRVIRYGGDSAVGRAHVLESAASSLEAES